MKERVKITLSELEDMMQSLRNVFDIVRLVEPHQHTIISFENGQMQQISQEPCFSVWHKNAECQNCISVKSCVEGKRMTKFEFIDEDVFCVITMPLEVTTKGNSYFVSMEMVNKVINDLLMSTTGETHVAAEIQKVNQRMYRDSLTGSYNRRCFDEKVYLYENISTMPKQIGFLILDINHFKYINDTFGHSKGDVILAEVATLIKRNVRTIDKVIRIGGDEFLLIIHDLPLASIEEKIKKISQATNDISHEWLEDTILSLSIGLSYTDDFQGTNEQIEELFNEADNKMYEQKVASRKE